MLLYRCYFPHFLQIKSEKTNHQIPGILEFGRQTSLQFESIWEMWLISCHKTTLRATSTLVMEFCGVGQGSLFFCQAERTPSIPNSIPPSRCLWEMMSLALTLIYVSVWKLLCCKVYASLGSQLVVHARSDSVAVCWSPIIDLREGGHWAV